MAPQNTEGAVVNGSSILLVYDDPYILKTIGGFLEKQGYRVSTAPSGEAAVEAMSELPFDLVITDLVMDETDGISVLQQAKSLNPQSRIMLFTGHGDLSSAIAALQNDADDYLLKPCPPAELQARVARCLERGKPPSAAELNDESTPQASSTQLEDQSSQPERLRCRVIEAESIILRDAQGNQRAQLSMSGEVPGFVFYDAHQVLRVALTVSEDGAGIFLHDENGMPRVALDEAKGKPNLTLYDETGNARLMVSGHSNAAGLSVHDKDGKARFAVGVRPDGQLKVTWEDNETGNLE